MDGMLCNNNQQCCSQNCQAGTCTQPPCLPDGMQCFWFGQCCSMKCTNFVCSP